jgi:hypothetical protein
MLNSTSRPRPPHRSGFEITDMTLSVGLLWTSDRQHSQETDINDPSRNRTPDPRSVYLFNIFINVTVECLGAEGTLFLVIRGLRISVLLYVIGLVQKYCKRWNLVLNLNKFKLMFLTK